jgi:hypothetical protein
MFMLALVITIIIVDTLFQVLEGTADRYEEEGRKEGI